MLFRDPAVGSLYKHDSPYTYFSSQDLHLGEISLECSRAGASAVALWAGSWLSGYFIIATNAFMLGFAFQKGAVPLSLEAILRAITAVQAATRTP